MTIHRRKQIKIWAMIGLLCPLLAACSAENRADRHQKQAEAFMQLAFNCPNTEIIDAVNTRDGSYYTEGSYVSGSGATAEEKFTEIFKAYIAEDYTGYIMMKYVGHNHIYAEENDTSSTVESLVLQESNTEYQYTFTLNLICTEKDGTPIPVELKGSLRFGDSNQIEMLKINSGLVEYYKALGAYMP